MIKILHVEDDADIREIVSLALGMSGQFGLTQHASGQEALEQLPALPPDILLLDVMMPGLTGFDVLDRLRTDPKMESVPAIFMTAYVDDPKLKTLRTEPGVDVIQKPIDPLQLGDQIKGMLSDMRS